MNYNEIEQSIDVFIQNNNVDYSILVNGEWGIGKTFYFQNELKKRYDESSEYKYVYVSLADCNTPEEVQTAIGLSYLERSNEFLKKADDLIGFSNLLGVIDKKKANIAHHAGRQILKGIQQYMVSKVVLILDDLERFINSSSIDVEQLFSKIHNHYTCKGSHVIYIANEDKITDDKYLSVREKYIRRKLEFSPDISSIIESIVRNDEFLKTLPETYKPSMLIDIAQRMKNLCAKSG